MAILIFIVMLVGLILVHEFGHFAVAKLFGIRVDEFGVGFPPKVWGKKYGETEYTINALPFGGFVRIFGENKEQGSVERGAYSSRSFAHKSKWIQASVLVAGVLMNVVGAWALLSVGYMIGLSAGSDYKGLGTVTGTAVTVLAVSPGSPADSAGVIGGEKVLSIMSASGATMVGDVQADDMRQFINAHGSEMLTLTIARGGSVRKVQAKPQTGIVEGRAVLGFVLDNVGVVQLPFYLAPIEGARLTYQLLQGTAFGLYDFIASIFRGKGDFSSVAGPVGIVGIVGQTSQFGIAALLLLAAIISINLSIVNLIPFPALDGGRIFLVIVEGITGKAVPARIFEGLNIAGFAILILLMLAVTYHDISKLFI